MPSYILKVDRETDLFVEWSTVVEAPTLWGTRADMDAAGVRPDRLDRASAKGSSCQGDIADWFTFDDTELIYRQRGWLPRPRLPELVERLAVDEDADVSDLLHPFDDDPEEFCPTCRAGVTSPEHLTQPCGEADR